MGKVPRVREDLARICSDLARRKAAEGHRMTWGVNGVISRATPFPQIGLLRTSGVNGPRAEITPFTPGQRGGRSARKRKVACSPTSWESR